MHVRADHQLAQAASLGQRGKRVDDLRGIGGTVSTASAAELSSTCAWTHP